MTEFLETKHSLATTAAASGVNNQTIKSYIKRELITLATDEGERISGGGGPGNRRGYSFFTVIELAIGKSLQEIGLSTDVAFQIANSFAAFGTGASGWVGEEKTRPERFPGLPFHYAFGETHLCWNGHRAEVVLQRKREGTLECFDDALTNNPKTKNFGSVGLVRLNVWPVFNRVTHALDGDPFELLNVAYRIHSGADLERFV